MAELLLLNGAAWLVNLPHDTTPVHVPDGKDPVRHPDYRGDVRGEADRSK